MGERQGEPEVESCSDHSFQKFPSEGEREERTIAGDVLFVIFFFNRKDLSMWRVAEMIQLRGRCQIDRRWRVR